MVVLGNAYDMNYLFCVCVGARWWNMGQISSLLRPVPNFLSGCLIIAIEDDLKQLESGYLLLNYSKRTFYLKHFGVNMDKSLWPRKSIMAYKYIIRRHTWKSTYTTYLIKSEDKLFALRGWLLKRIKVGWILNERI